jgi:hypothetical protein
MNSNAKHSIIKMEEDELKQLMTEVKETVATGISLEKKPAKQTVFGTAQLWHIQKMKKGIAARKTFIL